ncbi:hypothetical protein IKD67_02515 [Candidatus Saccharibacteria bacterium]|nr:hypothetical protein [Candidatus Saccharibacteria bacterium]
MQQHENSSSTVDMPIPGSTNTSPKTENDELSKDDSKKRKGLVIGVVLFVILAVFGIGFGVLAIIQNKQQGAETGHWYGKPVSADEISSIDIVYNDGKDHVQVTDEFIYYYAYNDEGNLYEGSSETIETDTSSIMKYVFENDLQYLNDENVPNGNKWSITVYAPGVSSADFGYGRQPEWFDEILELLNVDKYGYRYKED